MVQDWFESSQEDFPYSYIEAKMFNVTVRIPTSNIVISENHNDVEKAMARGEFLANSLGGSWCMTFKVNKAKIQ